MSIRGRLQVWWRKMCCAHHWHAADTMVRWRCCHCGHDVDGWPKDYSPVCMLEHELEFGYVETEARYWERFGPLECAS